jgi:excisionase family DNA binding protein
VCPEGESLTSIHQPLTVSVEAAATMLGISRSKLFPLIINGTIPSFKLGARRLVPVKTLESFIERQVELAIDEDGAYASASWVGRSTAQPLLHA